MVRDRVVETRGDRLAMARDAGLGRVSALSTLAGVMVAYGAFVVVLALVAAVLGAFGVKTNYVNSDWRTLSAGAGLVVAAVLFVAYLFGGYVAGRMARRSGLLHGVLVFLLGVLLAGAVALIARGVTNGQGIVANLRSVGIPTSLREWSHIGSVTGLVSLAAMFVGSLLGGGLGERWHGRLLARALDPSVGAEGAARRRAETATATAEQRHSEAERRVVQAQGKSTLERYEGRNGPTPARGAASGSTSDSHSRETGNDRRSD